jgi:hypothetical protein
VRNQRADQVDGLETKDEDMHLSVNIECETKDEVRVQTTIDHDIIQISA